MTKEEIQALIECAKKLINGSRSDKVAKIAEIALAALTAQPVKLPPPIQQTETSKYGLEAHDGYGLYWGSVETLNECKKLLSQQGYEVQE